MRAFNVALVVIVFASLTWGQAGVRGVPGYCPYGCGPYVPLITTPNVAFVSVSSSPVGATNATGGLEAGARNSTLSMIQGNTDAVHTAVVWYSGGGSPLVSPAVHLPHAELAEMHEGRSEHHGQAEGMHGNWVYFSGRMVGSTPVEASAAAKTGKRAARTYTNEDVDRVAAKSEQFRRK